VFFAEATNERCTAVLVLDVDSVGMVRGNAENRRWDQYVNDRPYAASSFLSTAMTEFFATAMGGRCKDRPELAETSIPLEFELPVLRCRGGEAFVRRLFEPLGYEVEASPLETEGLASEWTANSYLRIQLRITSTLQAALSHLYVLIPVMDDDKHYWVAKDEVEKLMRRGQDWLPSHPEREEITRRYLMRQHSLIRDALARLAEIEELPDPDATEELVDEPRISLHDIRLDAALAALKKLGARRVLDLGCGEGQLLRRLLKDPSFTEIVGMDVSIAALEKAKRRLRVDQLSDRQLDRLKLVHGSLTYRDATLVGYDGAALVEVIEHLDLARLSSLERVVFEFAQPKAVVVTTPNREYNALFVGLADDAMRHADHRFEWSRAEFAAWAATVAERFGYQVEITGVGPEDEIHGAPSQMAVFQR
jgi:3' terminal RNA ribose 2'-O-methyltransferase Hen1